MRHALIPLDKLLPRQGTGMLGMHRHNELLGGTSAERQKRRRAERKHAAALGLEDMPGGPPVTGATPAQGGDLCSALFCMHICLCMSRVAVIC